MFDQNPWRSQNSVATITARPYDALSPESQVADGRLSCSSPLANPKLGLT